MASLFGFGAFSTDVGALIEQATDNSASAGNIALHLQICDVINNSDNGPKDAIAAIRKRLTASTKNFHVINLTLTVLESCVKNCGIRFHVKIAQKDFLKDLTAVIQPKNNPPTIVRERILGLIQYWADAFKSKPELLAVCEVYDQLKADGVEFPPLDLDSLAPVETPERAQNARSQEQSSQPQRNGRSQRPLGPLKPEQIAKLLSELDVVRRNLDVMNEILVENEPGKEAEDDLTLMQELNTTLRAMQERVTQLIGRVQDEIILESLLQINDELNSSFTRYDRHMKNRQAIQRPVETQTQTQTPSSSIAAPPLPDTSASSISYPSLDDQPPPYEETGGTAVGQLIDLGIELTPIRPQTQEQGNPDIVQQLAQLGVTPQPSGGGDLYASDQHDDFDMFAQSRLAYSTGGSTYEDNIQQQGTSIASALHRQPQPDPATNPYENIQSWLGPTNQQQQTSDQVTSAGEMMHNNNTEFDQFLAERAAKGRHRPQMQQQEETTDELFQL